MPMPPSEQGDAPPIGRWSWALSATGIIGVVSAVLAAPHEALRGVIVLVAGMPLYWYWSRKSNPAPAH